MTPAEKRKETIRRRREQDALLEASYAEAERVAATGTCPQCGGKLKRNLALTGWWTCEQRGAEGFRKDASRPSCSFQCFTKY